MNKPRAFAAIAIIAMIGGYAALLAAEPPKPHRAALHTSDRPQ